MLSSVHAIVSSVEEHSEKLLTVVNEFREALQKRPPDAREAWNCACLLWRPILRVADAMCTKAEPRPVEGACGTRHFRLEQWQRIYGLVWDLLQLSNHGDCWQDMTVPAAFHAMQAQLQLFDAEVKL